MSFDEAATIPFSLFTAASALYLSLGLSYEPGLPESGQTVLIWVSPDR